MILILLLSSTLWTSIRSSIPAAVRTELIANLSVLILEERSANCIQIFRPDRITDRNMRVLHGLLKVMAVPASNTTTGVYSFDRYVKRKKGNPWKVTCYRPLKVVLGDEDSRVGYLYLLKELPIKDSVWLLFLDSNVEGFLSEANLIFDCQIIVARIQSEDIVLLYEVYRVRYDYPLRIMYYGNWTRQRGLDVLRGSLYSRRSDLEGITLKTGSIQNWPTSYQKGSTWHGFLIKIWYQLEELINCTSIQLESVDGNTGLKNPNGTWNGLVGMAIRREIDIIVSEITIEKTRTHVLDIFRPLIHTSYKLYFRQIGYSLQWTSVLKPFGRSIWFAIIFWMLLGAAAISLCYYLSLLHGFETDPEKPFSTWKSVFFMLQALSQQGHSNVPRSIPCRMVFFLSYMVSAVLIPSYSASLISYLTQQIPYRPFDTLEGLYTDGRYRILAKENTAEYGYFANAKTDLLKEIFKKQILPTPHEHKMMNSTHGFQILCRNPGYVFFGLEVIMNVRLGNTLIPECPVLASTTPISSVYLTMGAPKHSPYSGLINYHLSRMVLTGVAERFRNLEIANINHEGPSSQRQVALGEVFQMFVFIGLFFVVSSMILFFERVIQAQRQRKQKWSSRVEQPKIGYLQRWEHEINLLRVSNPPLKEEKYPCVIQHDEFLN